MSFGALYQMHLYEPGEKVTTTEIVQQCPERVGGKKKSTRVWQSLLASFQLKCCNREIAYKFVTLFPKRRKITL